MLCAVGDVGARALAAAIPYSPWLTRLDLRSNTIGEQVGELQQLQRAACSTPWPAHTR
jgi:hypothetical protein